MKILLQKWEKVALGMAAVLCGMPSFGSVCCTNLSNKAVVVPNYTDFNTDTSAASTFETTNRVQEVYQALQFPSEPIIIKELRFRPANAPYGGVFSCTISNIQIHLSTTTNSAGTLSTTFANNIGSDETTVYSGVLHLSSQFTGPANGPKDMDIVVPLQTPFVYNPANGNLLLDVATHTADGVGAFVQVFGQTGDTGSRVVALNPNSATASFSDTGVDAVKFIYEGNGAVVAPNYTAYTSTSPAASTFESTNRVQEVYQALQFPSSPIWIKELRFRPADAPYGGVFSCTVSDIQIHLSTTTASAGALSTTFANNVGGDDTTVYSGALHLSSQFTGPSSGPKDMDIVVTLQTPFLYDPANGNLLLDVFTRSADGTGAFVQTFGENNDTGSRVVALNPNSATASFADTGVDVVKFIYEGAGVVVGPNYTAYSTNSSAASTFETTNRVQEVYQAKQFPSGPISITEMRFRPADAPYGGVFSCTVSNIQIHLSTTSKAAGTLSTTFASNVGTDDTTVFNGSLHLSSQFTGPAVGPKDMDIVVHFQKPFAYNPANGNLLLDVITRSADGTGSFVQTFGESNDTGARVVALNPNSATASFSDTGVDAVKFIFDECAP